LSNGASWIFGTLHLTDFVDTKDIFCRQLTGEELFVSKTAAAVLVLVCLALLSMPMSAQLIPRGNVYVGGALEKSEIIIPHNEFHLKGWNGSGEFLPFARFSQIGLVFDASGFYRSGTTQYNFLGGPRLSLTHGKFRPFVHGLAGIQMVTTAGNKYQPFAWDVGGGIDYKLFFRNFSWRVQGDYVHTHYLSDNQKNLRGSTGIIWRF
jgi:hypothetical protein